jgi:hypothetical protein
MGQPPLARVRALDDKFPVHGHADQAFRDVQRPGRHGGAARLRNCGDPATIDPTCPAFPAYPD